MGPLCVVMPLEFTELHSETNMTTTRLCYMMWCMLCWTSQLFK